MSNFPNQAVVYLEGNPVELVSLLTDAATPQNSPKVINGSERRQIMLCDPLTGAALDLQNNSGGGNVATDNIWQAPGDIVVGTGFHTAARLAVGSPFQVPQVNAAGTGLQYVTLTAGGNALTSQPLSQFASTTSAQLAGVMSDETGTGSLVFGTSPTLVTPLLGVPTSGTLTNCTGLPISTGVSGLAANVAAFLATPSSVNLAAAVTNETGSGALVFANSPVLVTPNLGTPSAGTLTNCTGLPVATGISGLGTGVATALAVAVTGSGAPVLATAPTISAATLSGITVTDGANVTTASAMAALAIDVTKGLNTKTIAADSTFTFSGTPANSNQWFSVHVTNSDTNLHTLSFPSAFSVVTQAARTSCPIPASGQLWLMFRYDGSTYHVFGDSPNVNNFTATTNPAVTDDGTKGYGAGSLWGNTSANTLYWCESNATGAAVWNQVAGTGSGDMLLASAQTVTGAKTFNDATLVLAGSTSGTLTLHAIAVAGTGSLTFPAGTDTLVGKATTDTLTNKTLTSPTMTTPVLGTPASGTLTNCTGLPVSTGVSGLATGVATLLATFSSANLAAALTDETGSGAAVFATSPTLVTPLLGTPTSGTLTNCTGLPVSTGISGLAAGAATFLATPSSVNLAALMTDETGSGANVFANTPTLVTPILGTPTSGTLTNCTGLPVSTGISGLGTGAATFLATPTSANLAAMLTDETGTGANVFAASPALTGTPTINGTAAAIVNTISTQSAAYTFVLADGNTTIMHPSADTTARTWTIPANSSVAYPVGTILHIKNQLSAGVLTIAITTDTLTWARAAGGTGSRTLAAGGEASIMKVDSTHWEIVGSPELT
jgi:hypothetical protein